MRWLSAVIGLSILLAACSPSAPQPSAEAVIPGPTETEIGLEEGMPPTSESQATAAIETEVVDQEPAVEVREELVATDPTTVSLGNGTPALVEFFAFW